MERRLLKDFHIGIVEGVLSEALSTAKEPKDVFSQIAKVIGKRTTSNKKKDWNSLVRRNTFVRTDPIGTAQEAEQLRVKRQSLRRNILSDIQEKKTINPETLLGKYMMYLWLLSDYFSTAPSV